MYCKVLSPSNTYLKLMHVYYTMSVKVTPTGENNLFDFFFFFFEFCVSFWSIAPGLRASLRLLHNTFQELGPSNLV
ncbi:hypothetical protein CROQUDRAFT_571864 [Cronartium quercuum f. sp. fusiforme G11]|uniref:Uncharacterized protein n=1 Tax=Cronartium quercuum f. sp. fusiforme G11 TaxID=708437 RepID=A0A9P6NXD5_9BASI|nr:hypothetical protein CROQUDRAFT_571864 [Cronartium quercuum f. sp. fusiforme G11]